MNNSVAIFLLSDQVRGVMVTYEADENAPQDLCKTFNLDIAVDDFVVVRTDTRHNMTVCKVVEVDVDPDFDSSKMVQWIVGVINTVDYESLQTQEEELFTKIAAAEKRKRRDELRETLLANAGDEIKALPIYSVDTEAG